MSSRKADGPTPASAGPPEATTTVAIDSESTNQNPNGGLCSTVIDHQADADMHTPDVDGWCYLCEQRRMDGGVS